MRYSRFDERAGVYDVFEDDRQAALNADLPVPTLPPPAGTIGVPARNAGRALPRGAKRIGTSWHPVGIIVATEPNPLGALDIGALDVGYLILGAAVGLGVAWLVAGRSA